MLSLPNFSWTNTFQAFKSPVLLFRLWARAGEVAVKQLFDPNISAELLAEFDNEVQKLELLRPERRARFEHRARVRLHARARAEQANRSGMLPPKMRRRVWFFRGLRWQLVQLGGCKGICPEGEHPFQSCPPSNKTVPPPPH